MEGLDLLVTPNDSILSLLIVATTRGVRMGPGQMALTRIPFVLTIWLLKALVNPTIAYMKKRVRE
jgi:hypothetical protein